MSARPGATKVVNAAYSKFNVMMCVRTNACINGLGQGIRIRRRPAGRWPGKQAEG